MASKGKKGKGRGKTLDLTEFLGGNGGGSKYQAPGAAGTVAVDIGSWADQMEEGEAMYERRDGPAQKIVLPTGPAANFGPDLDVLDKVPKHPPFTAYIANLPYDVDEIAVQEVFERARLKISQVRLMKDEGGRLRGYGYADFEDRESLIDVLTMTDLAVNNRKMRIDLASQANKSGGGGGFDRDGKPRQEDPDAGRSDADDCWRRGPPPAPRPGYEGRGSDDRDRGRDRGSFGDRDRDRDGGRDGGSRSGFGGGGGYEPPRDRGGYDRDRGGDRGGDRYGDRDRGGDRGGDRYGDRDRGGGARDRLQETPKERPKMNLAPRSTATPAEAGGAAASSIFGGAKPVDTLQKERELAEKQEKDKEAKEKAREEARKAPKSNPFGSAKPVDVTKREKEMEEKLSKLSVKAAEEKEVEREKPPIENAWRVRKPDEDSKPSAGAYRPPGASDRDRDRGGDRYGDRRRDDRGGSDRRDDYRRDDRGSDRRDDRGSDRRDDRGSDRRDDYRREDRGGSDRRDDYRRDDRGGSDRRDDRGSSGQDRRDDREERRDGGRSPRPEEKEQRGTPEKNGKEEEKPASAEKPTPEKPMKKLEEPKPVAVATNKFGLLQEEGSGEED